MKQQQINKNEWKEIELKELIEIIAGQAPPSSSYNQKGQGIAFLRVNSFGDKHPISESWTTMSLKTCKKGDILLSVAGTIGAVNIADKDYSITRSIFALRPNIRKINLDYLYYFLKTLKIKLKNSGTGSSQKIITLGIVNRLKIPLPLLPNGTPDLKEQERIVKILEENERQLKRADRSKELLSEYLKSTFWEMFYNKGFEIKKIRDVLEYSQYGTSMKSNSERKGYKVLGMNSITYDGHIDISKHNYVDITKEEYNKLKLENGDIIFNRTNSKELVGKTAYWNLNENVVLASYLVKLRLKKIINPIFFTYLLNTNKYKKLFEMRSRKAVNQANLSPTLLKEFEVMLPPLPLQQKFSRIVEQVEKMKENVNKTKQNAEELFNSLMQKAFKGELV